MATEKGRTTRKKNETVVVADPGKVQPQAVELERVVLGALMLEKDAFSAVSDILKPECFYDKRHELIFGAIVSLAAGGEPIDILTVSERLKKDGGLEAAGGILYVSQLTNMVASTSHLIFHAKIVAQKYIARELIRFSGLIQGKAFDESIDIEDLMQEAEASLFEISQRNIKKDAIQIDSVISEAIDVIKKSAEKKGGMTGLPSGYVELDKITSGWQDSDLIIIAARPAMGKTAFVLSMAKNMAIDFKAPIAIFSLEMSNRQLVNRLISNVCELEGNKIRNGQLEKYEWEQLDHKIVELYQAPIYVDDTPSLSIFELRTKARRLVREHQIRCIIIDYLQLMNASGMAYGSREQEVSMISRSLKGLAKELNIPIIALSQLNRGIENRTNEGKRPQLSDLRESGAIEQDADMVCFIHRPDYYKIYEDKDGNDIRGQAEIIVAKHRNGAVGDINLYFKKEYARFENLGIRREYSSNIISGGSEARQEKQPPIGANDDFLAESNADAANVPY